MSNTEKTVSYTTENTYLTQNELTSKTKNVWLVFHGIGYLSRYFVKYFNGLNPEENYIIVPQAPSKYYLKNEYKYVGASWLTKENTATEINNVLNYIDAVLEAEHIPKNTNLILFGFSQGVSVATRWLASKKLPCSLVVLYAGGIPNELSRSDFEFLDYDTTKVQIVYGDQDEFLTPERLKKEKVKVENLFQGNAQTLTFNGGHEVKPEIIEGLLHQINSKSPL
ncbi:alpha/beta hydrolase [Flagellimonas okinawensis]|uniref:Esterase n=1 Tax=Flagellimonas okinawensis TaxID=3031324 RepID=A0ABT5XRA2_9FLAO|nr:esterase [[Muricauda] okinawensis]MDF0708426.1 esterase [[Muricauda] okinawensis]